MSPAKTHPKVQQLYDKGIKSVIPLLKGKAPGYANWQKVTDEEAQENIWGWGEEKEGTNFGIRLGRGFGEIVDIDLDCSESRLLAKYYLPETAKFGRGGAVTHYIYRSGVKDSRRFSWDKRDEKSVLLELRASGQTMGPGSIHPTTGEEIEWYGSSGITTVDARELEEAVAHLAAASLLLRDWTDGCRDELSVCLVGSMLRAGWEDDAIDGFLRGILIESGDEQGDKRLKAERLREVLAADGRVPGLKRLREICVGGVCGEVRGFNALVEWLDLGGGDVVEELNAQYAVVRNGGSVSILHEGKGGTISFLSRRDFSLLMANRMVDKVTADRFWLGHQDRREYPGGVVFDPGLGVGGGAGDGVYNLWRGFTVEESEGTWGCGWELYLGHLRDNVCSGSEELLRYLLSWMAQRVQRPGDLPGSAVVLIGQPGCGKSLVFRLLGELFGEHYVSVTQGDHLSGKFNYHLANKCLVLADEATWGGDKTREGVLKTIITENTRMVEMKGRDSFSLRNCVGLGVCSNHEWVVPVDANDRRYFVVRVGSGRVRDFRFWDAVVEQMSVSGGGLSRMLYDLRRYDISGWDAGIIPNTGIRDDQMSMGLPPVTQFLLEFGDDAGRGGCDIEISVDDLYEKYVRSRRRGHLEIRLHFKRLVEQLCGAIPIRVKLKNGKREARFRFKEGWLEKLEASVGLGK